MVDKTHYRIGQIAKTVGVRQSTLKYYVELGILPFHQTDSRLSRWFDMDEVKRVLVEISRLKSEGKPMELIKKELLLKRVTATVSV